VITNELILSILSILVVAWTLGWVFYRFGLPAMLGELLAGLILGPPLLGIVGASPPIELIAELGIFFVMFHTGMEMDPKELLEHIWPSISVALGGFALPFLIGFLTARFFGGTLYQSLFVGMGISITAIAVNSVILHSMAISRTSLGHIIIGAAIADDILSLIALSVLLGLARSGTVDMVNLAVIVLKVAGFFGLTILIGHFIVPSFTRRLNDREGKAFTFAIVSALVMGYLAELAGLHLIIGAFLAGQFVREEIMDGKIYTAISDRFYALSYGFLLPIFFASLSFHLQLSLEWTSILFVLVLTGVAILGKLVGCGLGLAVFGYSRWESAIVGFGMNGRGAVELVLASVVIKLGSEMIENGTLSEPLLTEGQFTALVLMAFVTTLIAPLSLKWAVLRTCQGDERATFCEMWDAQRE
jgi:Kef-type K+ transport system membrane component KefB